MANNQATQKQPKQNQETEKQNQGETSWRPTDDKSKKPTKNPTGLAEQSPSPQTGDPGRTPGKAEGEDFAE